METRRYSTAEVCRIGQELYNTKIRPHVEYEHFGKILVVDIETGEYEIDTDQLAAAHRARGKRADAPLFGLRIGYPSLGSVGGGWGRVQRPEKP